MKSFKQFISESVNIAGDFTGNLYINSSQQEPSEVGEGYVADVMWEGNLYRLELVTKNGVPSTKDLTEQLQSTYPGAIVHQIYPVIENHLDIKKVSRYHPSKLEWID